MRSEQVTTLTHESIEQFRSSLSDRGQSTHTVKSYASDLRMLLQEGGHSSVPLSQLELVGQRWLTANRATLKPKTTQRRLTSLRAFARWAGHRDMFLEYKPPTPDRPRPQPLAERMEGVRRMVEAADTDDLRVIVALCGFAGLRISEALSVQPRNIDFARKTILIRGKGDKERTVPMSSELATVLAATVVRRYGEPTLVNMGDRSARDRITKLGEQVGLAHGMSSHHLRATFATQLMEDTHDLRLVQELLGHASSRTTEAYTEVTMDRQRDAVNNL